MINIKSLFIVSATVMLGVVVTHLIDSRILHPLTSTAPNLTLLVIPVIIATAYTSIALTAFVVYY